MELVLLHPLQLRLQTYLNMPLLLCLVQLPHAAARALLRSA
jgi:hypothetical protein